MYEEIGNAGKRLFLALMIIGGFAVTVYGLFAAFDEDADKSAEKVAVSVPVVPLPGDCCLIPANRGLYGRGVPR